MTGLLEQSEHSIRIHRLFRRGERILVAVSGGLDSMVLLHVLQILSKANAWQVRVAHFNHQLRGQSSDADECLVRRTCKGLGLRLMVGRADVRAFSREEKLSLEMGARRLRHDFLARTAGALRLQTVALAHHADDQVELFLLRLLRGGGSEGLAGMKWQNPSPSNPSVNLVRPLLDVARSDLLEFAKEHGIRFREDASNRALDIQRNRVRHELVPLLKQKYQPALNKTLRRVMEILGAEGEFVTDAAQRWLARVRSAECGVRSNEAGRKGGGLEFEELHLAVQRRCLQLQLLAQGLIPDFDLIECLRLKPQVPISVRVGKEIRGAAGQSRGGGEPKRASEPATQGAICSQGESKNRTRTLPCAGRLCVIRDRTGRIRLHTLQPMAFQPTLRVVDLKTNRGKGRFDGVEFCWRIQAAKGSDPRRRAVQSELFDAERVGGRIVLRHWQPGDRFQPIGMPYAVKLQDLFVSQKVPRFDRRDLIVAATAKGELFWVENMRISERFKLTEVTNRRLQWTWQRL